MTADDDQDERARIINNDQYPSTASLYNGSSDSGQDAISYGSMNNGGSSNKTMEQSALDKIYQKMAANVIDVAPGESMIIQPAEFTERQRNYQARLNQIKTPLPLKSSTHHMTKHGGTLDATTTRINTSVTSVGGVSSNWARVGNQLNNTSSTGQSGHNSINVTISGNSPQHMNKTQEKRRIEYEPISVEDTQLINEISERTVKAIKELKIDYREQVVTHFQP